MSYVFRKSGWQTVDGLYQRMVVHSKIKNMRKYLVEKKRVFINNLIVGLSEDQITIIDEGANGLTKTQPITIKINDESNIIGLIDGQHRVYAYHEGDDNYEDAISKSRKVQNLLVTGIVYPNTLTENDQLKFEAGLFLEINSTQTGAASELKQSIELILNPSSTTAIAKSIVLMLAEHGALATRLKVFFYDKGKIPTTSIVSYGLRPLVKLSGDDSLFSIWDDEKQQQLLQNKDNVELLGEYKTFCTQEINKILNAYKRNIPTDLWTTNQKKSKFLTTTSINGLVNCLRILTKNKQNLSLDGYVKKLTNVKSFNFRNYKSSQWKSLGSALHQKYFK